MLLAMSKVDDSRARSNVVWMRSISFVFQNTTRNFWRWELQPNLTVIEIILVYYCPGTKGSQIWSLFNAPHDFWTSQKIAADIVRYSGSKVNFKIADFYEFEFGAHFWRKYTFRLGWFDFSVMVFLLPKTASITLFSLSLGRILRVNLLQAAQESLALTF